MKMEHQRKSDVMHQPGPEILAQWNFMHFSSLGRRLETSFELGQPSRSELLVRHPDESPVVEEAPHAQAIHDLLVRVAGPSLNEARHDEMDHENKGRSRRVQGQNSFEFREGRTFDASIEHRRIKRLFAGKMFVK